MEAVLCRSLTAIVIAVSLALPASSFAGSARTQNFIVTAPTRALAQEIANEAERFRKELAVSWLGRELPPWREPCPVVAKVSNRLGAGGQTSFMFETEQRQFARPTGDGLFQAKPAGRPFGWDMSIQGSRERILDSVLPHEITHTIFATHFGRPLPRWADEGACTTVEHDSEKLKQHRMLYEFLRNDRGIAFNQMFAMTEYPTDILPLYSQGFSLARYFVMQGGRQKFVNYVGEGLETNNWTDATKKYYGFNSLSDLQVTWLEWVRNNSPNLPNQSESPATLIASNPSGRQFGRAPNQPFTQSPNAVRQASASTNSQRGDSWYAQQKNARKPAAQKSFVPKQDPRVATRPNRDDQQREVLLEWGEPSPIMNPTLASPTGFETIR